MGSEGYEVEGGIYGVTCFGGYFKHRETFPFYKFQCETWMNCLGVSLSLSPWHSVRYTMWSCTVIISRSEPQRTPLVWESEWTDIHFSGFPPGVSFLPPSSRTLSFFFPENRGVETVVWNYCCCTEEATLQFLTVCRHVN